MSEPFSSANCALNRYFLQNQVNSLAVGCEFWAVVLPLRVHSLWKQPKCAYRKFALLFEIQYSHPLLYAEVSQPILLQGRITGLDCIVTQAKRIV